MLRDITKEILNFTENYKNYQNNLTNEKCFSQKLTSNNKKCVYDENKENCILSSSDDENYLPDSKSNYNNPLLPISKTNDDIFKINLINKKLKNKKFSIYNSAENVKQKYLLENNDDDDIFSNKKIKKIHPFHSSISEKKIYQSQINFISSKKHKLIHFKIFKEDDVITNSPFYYDLLIENEADEDVDTDRENLSNGYKLSILNIKEAIRQFNPKKISHKIKFCHKLKQKNNNF